MRAINDFEAKFQACYGIGLNEGMLLCSILKSGECSSSEAAAMLGLSPSNASKVIASAERKGLIQRVVGQSDKRKMIFSMTDQGRTLMSEIKCNPGGTDEIIAQIKQL